MKKKYELYRFRAVTLYAQSYSLGTIHICTKNGTGYTGFASEQDLIHVAELFSSKESCTPHLQVGQRVPHRRESCYKYIAYRCLVFLETIIA